MAEGRYTRIKSKFWTDEKARKWDGKTKFLALYLLTSPHNNILGCYVLPKLYICADLSWDDKQLSKPFTRLLQDGFIKYDESNCLILLCNYLKHNPIENGNQATGAIKQYDELPKSPLLQDLKHFIEQLGKPFLKPLIERIGKPVTVTVTETVTITTTTPLPPANTADDFDPAAIEADGSSSRELFKSFEREMGRLLSSFEAEEILSWTENHSPEVIEHALKQAILNNVRTFKYIRGILANWKGAGVKCVQDVDELERKHKEQKERNKASPVNKDTKREPVYEIYVPPTSMANSS